MLRTTSTICQEGGRSCRHYLGWGGCSYTYLFVWGVDCYDCVWGVGGTELVTIVYLFVWGVDCYDCVWGVGGTELVTIVCGSGGTEWCDM